MLSKTPCRRKGCARQIRAAALPAPPGFARARQSLELLMSAILVVAIFLVVFAALNRFEFGRFD